MYTILSQPNSTPMPGPRGRRNNQNQDQCFAICTGELIRMVYASNNRTMPTIQVSSVLEIYGQLIKDNFQLGNIGNVGTEEMIMNFMLNIDPFHYNSTLYLMAKIIYICVHIVVTK